MVFKFSVVDSAFVALVEVETCCVLVTDVSTNLTSAFSFDYLNAHYPMLNLDEAVKAEIEDIFLTLDFF
ncbi:MAG: hypothetical protein WBF90_33730 [Rivularia sp. (in: cyanobacteria)]